MLSTNFFTKKFSVIYKKIQVAAHVLNKPARHTFSTDRYYFKAKVDGRYRLWMAINTMIRS